MRKRWLALLRVILMLIIIVVFIGITSIWYVLKGENKSTTIADVVIQAEDRTKLAASEILSKQFTHRWVILVHPYRTNRLFMKPYAERYQSEGYNTLSPDNRAHGSSGGDYIGMGYLDQYDIRSWIDYIIGKDSDAEIVLHGVSMGGAALMMLSGQENLPSNIKVIIEDCGYISATEYLTWKLKQRFHLPAFPVIPITNIAFKVAAGYYMDDASAIEGVKNSNIPMLFIHGTEDTTVPVEDVYRLYDVATCQKHLYVVDGAGHGEARITDEEKYWTQVFSFIEDNFVNSYN